MFNFPLRIITTSRLKRLENAKKEAEYKITEILTSLASQRGLAVAVLRSMRDGVLAVDGSGSIVLANFAIEKMFGVLEPELLGKSVRAGIRNNEIADLIDQTIKTNTMMEKEINTLFPIEGNFLVFVTPMVIGDNKPTGAVCVLHNITDIKKLETYRSEFVANVSHELKTPLTSIRNYLETLLNGAIKDNEHNMEFLRKADKNAINLSALIDDLLEISRLESKKELGPYIKLDTNKIMARAIENISDKAKKKNISINKNCDDKEHNIIGIEDHIYRAFLNLLDNAVNYTPEGGSIDISCFINGDKLEISVSDTGIGIPEEHLPRIFERFYRVDKARSRDLGGTGLGLAIVKHVANIHNGSVSVSSREGQGSKFTLVFPSAK
ncbi:PAS domain S-box protein [Candidatus Saganbacteria bacterium]|nr:PAS domain S-box protein [Candidatus Saganbacteria bacterium]